MIPVKHDHGQRRSYKYTVHAVSFGQDKSVELSRSSFNCCHTPLKERWPRPLHMHTNVFADLKQVRIIEVPDKRGPDNRDCTV